MSTTELDHAYQLSFRTQQPLSRLLRLGLQRIARCPPRRDVDE